MLQKRAISIHALRLMLYDPVAGHGAMASGQDPEGKGCP
jgi:hypothetical protein